MNQIEMLTAMLENPERKAVLEDDISNDYLAFDGNQLKWHNKHNIPYQVYIVNTEDQLGKYLVNYKIIEPIKPVKIDDALIAYYKNKVIQSLINNKKFKFFPDTDSAILIKATAEQIKGDWVILDD